MGRRRSIPLATSPRSNRKSSTNSFGENFIKPYGKHLEAPIIVPVGRPGCELVVLKLIS
jgi:hypothetical protein